MNEIPTQVKHMKEQRFDNNTFRQTICSDLKHHQVTGKRHNEPVFFEESLKYLENNLECNSLEEVDAMIQTRTLKSQNWHRANKYALNMDVYYLDVEVCALRRFKCKIYQQFKLKWPLED